MTGTDIAEFLSGIVYDLLHPADAEMGWLLFKLLVLLIVVRFGYMVAMPLWQPFRRHWWRVRDGWKSRGDARRRRRQERRDAPLRAAEQRAWQQEQDRLAAERAAREQAERDADQQRRDAALAQITDNLKID